MRFPSSPQNEALSPQQKSGPAEVMQQSQATEGCSSIARKRDIKNQPDTQPRPKKMRRTEAPARADAQRVRTQTNKASSEFARREFRRREHENRLRAQTSRAIDETKLIARHLTLNKTKDGRRRKNKPRRRRRKNKAKASSKKQTAGLQHGSSQNATMMRQS